MLKDGRRRDRAMRRASYASKRTPSKVLAMHMGISESRVRHQRTDDPSGALTTVLAMIADPKVDADAILTVLLESYDERFMCAQPDELRDRLLYLRHDREHVVEAAQNRATVVMCPQRSDAYRTHAGVLIEMASIEEVLGPGSERAH